jgi:hypothetical protein
MVARPTARVAAAGAAAALLAACGYATAAAPGRSAASSVTPAPPAPQQRSLSAAGPPESEPEPEPEPELCRLVDEEGRELCLKHAGLRRGRCRFGAQCHRSHAPPSTTSLALIREMMMVKSQTDNSPTRAGAEGGTEGEVGWIGARQLPAWLHSCRSELIFDCRGRSSRGRDSFGRLHAAVCRLLAAATDDCSSDNCAYPPLSQLHRRTAEEYPSDCLPVAPALASAHRRQQLQQCLQATAEGSHHQDRVCVASSSSSSGSSQRRKQIQSEFESTVAHREFIEAFQDFVALVVTPLVLRDAPRAHRPAEQDTIAGGPGSRRDETSTGGGLAYQCPPTLRVHMPGRTPTIGLHCDAEYEHHHPAEINFWIALTDADARCVCVCE